MMLLGGYYGVSIFSQSFALKREITRIYLLRGLEDARLENSQGDYVDIKIADISLQKADQQVGTLLVKVGDR